MKISIVAACAVLALAAPVFASKPTAAQAVPAAEADYQKNADAKRIADVHKIAALLDEYKKQTGHYPYYDRPVTAPYGKDAYMVAVGMESAEKDLRKRPNPFNLPIKTFYSADLIKVLKAGLKRDLVLPVDPQKSPVAAPNAYFVFFIGDDTYLVTAFVYSPTPDTAPLGRNVNLYGVSSGPLNGFLGGMRLRPRLAASVPATELAAIQAAGERADAAFGKLGPISTGQ